MAVHFCGRLWGALFGATLLLAPLRSDEPLLPPDPESATPQIALSNPAPAPVPQLPSFSDQPTAEEITAARIFEEPLVFAGGEPTDEENFALANALEDFAARTRTDDFSALENYLQAGANEHWYGSVEFCLGWEYYNCGYYSRAIGAWEEAWQSLRSEEGGAAKRLADRTIGELAKMHARVGGFERLDEIFLELGDRPLSGSGASCLAGARQALWMMKNRPEVSFRCGPLALRSISLLFESSMDVDEVVMESAFTQQGFSLSQVQELSVDLDMGFQMAQREPGSAFIVPSVVHWKVGHYAAILSESNGRYSVADPTFGQSRSISQEALEDEASGYFLVPAGDLPNGWSSVTDAQGANIWGRGVTTSSDPNATTTYDTMADPDCDSRGMATCNIHLLLVSLHLEDTPLSFTPPRGPPVAFTVTYNQLEANQPANFSYSNLGPRWTCNWISYLVDNGPASPGDVNYYVPGGGTELFSYNSTNHTYAIQWRNQATLSVLSSNSYLMVFPDGSQRIFGQPDGTVGNSRKVFLTQVISPTGYTNLLNYDASLRLVTVTDLQANLTNLTFYYNTNTFAGSGYTIQQVTDRYGRSATLTYETLLTQLDSITDVLGLTSQVFYASSTAVVALQTPYGTTSAVSGDDGAVRWIEVTDPQGNTARAEYNQTDITGIPSSDPGPLVPTTLAGFYCRNFILVGRNTFYWDKQAQREAPGDYSKARIYHWLHNQDLSSAVGALESVKEPLESRVWFNYPGQNPSSWGATRYGTQNLPSGVARVLDDGTEQLYLLGRNTLGYITNLVDPVSRSFTYNYATNNLMDLLEVRQTTSGSNDLVASFTYNSQHLPLTATDASGQASHYGYNTYGQLTAVTNALAQITTLSYDASGRLSTIVGPTNNANVGFTYDAFDRIRTATNVDGYTVTVDYDAFDRPLTNTFPDGSQQIISYKYLDPDTLTDRTGNTTRFVYDSLRRLIQVTQSTNWVTRLDWCNCGGVASVTDPLGRVTQWFHDIQGRVVGKRYPDGSQVSYAYEDSTSRVKSFTNERGQTRTYNYYTDNSLTNVVYSDPSITPTVSFGYDAYHRLSWAVDGLGTNYFTYFPVASPPALGAGRLKSANGPWDDTTIYADNVEYTYDTLGRLQSERMLNTALSNSIPNTFYSYFYTNSWSYDPLGRVSQVANRLYTTNTLVLGIFTNTYIGGSARLSSVTYPNNQSANFSYYGVSGDFLLQALTNKISTGTNLSSFTYAYDKNGRITNWVQGTQTNLLSYDALGQLLTNAVNGSNMFRYAYDLAGNRTSEQVGTNVWRGWFNPLNQLVGKDRGNSSTNRQYQWDEENHLHAIVEGSLQTVFWYDAFGRCAYIAEFSNVTETLDRRLIWSGSRFIAEFDVDSMSNGYWKWYYPGGYQDSFNRISNSPVSVYFTHDHLGSVREVTRASDSAIEAQFTYDPYGRRSTNYLISFGAEPHSGIQIGFTGLFSLEVQGLVMARHRVYDPDLGRWLSRDPIQETGGLNLYGYACNDPINQVDLDGLCEQKGFVGGPGQFWDPNIRKIRGRNGEVLKDQVDPLNPINFEGENGILGASAEEAALNALKEAAEGTVDLYRAVGVREFNDVMANKAFQAAGNSMSARQFGFTMEEALHFADADPSKVAILKATVPESILPKLDFSTTIDPFIFKNGVITVHPEMQPLFNQSLKAVEHVY